jgi:hypothetical protein
MENLIGDIKNIEKNLIGNINNLQINISNCEKNLENNISNCEKNLQNNINELIETNSKLKKEILELQYLQTFDHHTLYQLTEKGLKHVKESSPDLTKDIELEDDLPIGTYYELVKFCSVPNATNAILKGYIKRLDGISREIFKNAYISKLLNFIKFNNNNPPKIYVLDKKIWKPLVAEDFLYCRDGEKAYEFGNDPFNIMRADSPKSKKIQFRSYKNEREEFRSTMGAFAAAFTRHNLKNYAVVIKMTVFNNENKVIEYTGFSKNGYGNSGIEFGTQYNIDLASKRGKFMGKASAYEFSLRPTNMEKQDSAQYALYSLDVSDSVGRKYLDVDAYALNYASIPFPKNEDDELPVIKLDEEFIIVTFFYEYKYRFIVNGVELSHMELRPPEWGQTGRFNEVNHNSGAFGIQYEGNDLDFEVEVISIDSLEGQIPFPDLLKDVNQNLIPKDIFY